MASPAFQLSAQLIGHDADVRAVVFPNPDAVLSASRDCSVRLWQRKGDPSSANPFEAHVANQGSDYVNSITYLPPTPEYPEGLVVSGGRDTIIDVRKPTSLPGDNAERLLIGHSHNVCTLDVSPKGTYIVSGGWDSQARVWSVAKWDTEFVLTGHELSVWAVLFLDEHTVVTGCADKNIRIYDLRKAVAGDVQPRSTIYTDDIIRAVGRVPAGHATGGDIVSASNDGVLRFWKLNGQMVGELRGHDSFVYGLAVLPSGEIVSCAEDRTVRVWKDLECVQTITHPAISVWCVAACPDTGDIVSGASDGLARVFTRNPDKVAGPDVLAAFEESVKASAIPQQQVGSINKEKLPGTEFLTTRSGTKEGQVQMIKEDNGSVSAYTWSMAAQQWVNVGTVVDSAGSSGRKVEYEGKSYDFVFDVDIEDGKPPLKLPFNLSENPYDRARKFLEDNELPISYLDNVVQFIEQNTKGATLGESNDGGPDPYGSDARYKPSDEAARVPKVLPQGEYLSITAAKHEAIVNKIINVNASMISAGRKDAALNPADQTKLKELRYTLQASKPIDDAGLELIMRIVTKWAYSDRLPGLDLLRCATPSAAVAAFRDLQGRSAIQLGIDAALGTDLDTDEAPATPNENCIMMILRAVANVFATPKGREVAASDASRVLGLLERVVGLNGPGVGRHNRNVLLAATTVVLNYAVLARKSVGASFAKADSKKTFTRVVERIISEQTDGEVVYRALVALGTWLYGNSSGAESIDKDVVRRAIERIKEDRITGVGKEVLSLLG